MGVIGGKRAGTIPVGSGQWAFYGSQSMEWAVWAVGSGQRALGRGQRALGSYSRQWAVGVGRFAVHGVGGVDGGQCNNNVRIFNSPYVKHLFSPNFN